MCCRVFIHQYMGTCDITYICICCDCIWVCLLGPCHVGEHSEHAGIQSWLQHGDYGHWRYHHHQLQSSVLGLLHCCEFCSHLRVAVPVLFSHSADSVQQIKRIDAQISLELKVTPAALIQNGIRASVRVHVYCTNRRSEYDPFDTQIGCLIDDIFGPLHSNWNKFLHVSFSNVNINL